MSAESKAYPILRSVHLIFPHFTARQLTDVTLHHIKTTGFRETGLTNLPKGIEQRIAKEAEKLAIQSVQIK